MNLKNVIVAALAAPGMSLALTIATHAATVSLVATQDASFFPGHFSQPGNGNDPYDAGGLYNDSGSTKYYSVMQWDLSSLPANAVVTDAYFSVYRLSSTAVGWSSETTLTDALAGHIGVDDDATFTHNKFNGLDSSGNPDASGYDYQATAVASAMTITYTGTAAIDSVHASAGDLSLINGRLSMASSGDRYLLLKIRSPSGTSFFQDHELSQSSGAGFGPTLNLEYSVVPEPATFALAAFALVGMCVASRARRFREKGLRIDLRQRARTG